MIGSVIWEYKTGWYFQTYLPWDSLVPSERMAGSITIGTLVFFSYAIVLNTLVPISLYVRYVYNIYYFKTNIFFRNKLIIIASKYNLAVLK